MKKRVIEARAPQWLFLNKKPTKIKLNHATLRNCLEDNTLLDDKFSLAN